MSVSRREFLGRTAAGLALGSLALQADPLGLPIGCQVYPVRHAFAKDIDGTLKQLADIGYRSLEMCSPPGYGREDFGPLVDWKPAQIRDRIHAAGLACDSSHFGFRELRETLDDRIEYARELGLKQMVLSSFGLRAGATLDDWTRVAAEFNKIAERIHAAGMDVGYHNHSLEFQQLDGVLIYDRLMNTFDPKLVRMQFQVSVISLGYEAATFFTKYPGRFLSLHLQDLSKTEKKPIPIGQGMVDWKKLFSTAKAGGIKNYFVEMGMNFLGPSWSYLHQLQV